MVRNTRMHTPRPMVYWLRSSLLAASIGCVYWLLSSHGALWHLCTRASLGDGVQIFYTAVSCLHTGAARIWDTENKKLLHILEGDSKPNNHSRHLPVCWVYGEVAPPRLCSFSLPRPRVVCIVSLPASLLQQKFVSFFDSFVRSHRASFEHHMLRLLIYRKYHLTHLLCAVPCCRRVRPR